MKTIVRLSKELTAARREPLPPKGQLEAWVAEYQATGSRAALDSVCRHCTRLVLSRVNHWYRSGGRLDAEAMFSEGMIGVVKAANKYDANRQGNAGRKAPCFLTYALLWVDAMLSHYTVKAWNLVVIGKSQEERREFFDGVDKRVRPEMRERKKGELSLQAPRRDMENESDGKDWQACLEDESGATPEQRYAGEHDQTVAARRVDAALRTLEPRLREIIIRRWLVEPKASLEQLGEEQGVSKERVRQLESRGLQALALALGVRLTEKHVMARLHAAKMAGCKHRRRPNRNEHTGAQQVAV